MKTILINTISLILAAPLITHHTKLIDNVAYKKLQEYNLYGYKRNVVKLTICHCFRMHILVCYAVKIEKGKHVNPVENTLIPI